MNVVPHCRIRSQAPVDINGYDKHRMSVRVKQPLLLPRSNQPPVLQRYRMEPRLYLRAPVHTPQTIAISGDDRAVV
jgi:hypothetical protein